MTLAECSQLVHLAQMNQYVCKQAYIWVYQTEHAQYLSTEQVFFN